MYLKDLDTAAKVAFHLSNLIYQVLCEHFTSHDCNKLSSWMTMKDGT